MKQLRSESPQLLFSLASGVRESSLQKADEEERGQETNKRKRKASELDNEAEYWVMKRQRLKAGRQEEALKRKRTVFVGNLPSSCTKKVFIWSHPAAVDRLNRKTVCVIWALNHSTDVTV